MAVQLLLVGPLLAPATGALFVDRDTNAGNGLQAAAVDGKLSEAGPATQNSTTDEATRDTVRDTWEDYDHANGTSDAVSNTVEVGNPDTSAGVSSVNVTASYVENDTALLNDGDPDATAKTLNVTTFSYDGTDARSAIADVNGNGFADIDDLSRQNVTLGGIAANGSASLTIEIAGDAALSGSIGGDDGIDFTLSVTLIVDPSWTDTDTSVDNTVQYETV